MNGLGGPNLGSFGRDHVLEELSPRCIWFISNVKVRKSRPNRVSVKAPRSLYLQCIGIPIPIVGFTLNEREPEELADTEIGTVIVMRLILLYLYSVFETT